MQIIDKGKFTELLADEGLQLHKINTDEWYSRRRILLPSEEADDFEDGTPPVFSVDEYEAKVSELIRDRYTVDAELAILRQRDTKPDEFNEYNTFAEACKREAKQILTNDKTDNNG